MRPKNRYYSVAVDFGFMLLASVLLIGGAGYWLDKRLGTSPIFLFIGILLGLGTAFQSLLRRLRWAEEAEKAERASTKPSQGDRDTPPR